MYRNPLLSIKLLAGMLLFSLLSVPQASAELMITNNNFVSANQGLGTYTLDSNYQATSSLSNGVLVANQKGIISYSAKREGDPRPTLGRTLDNTLFVSLYLDSASPLIAKNPKIAFNYLQTNQGGAGTTVLYDAAFEMYYSFQEFQDADGDHIYDSGEVILPNGISANYLTSGFLFAGTEHAVGDVNDLLPLGNGIVELTLNPHSHYLLIASYDMTMDAGNIAFDPMIPTTMATSDSSGPNFQEQQWVLEFQPVPEPSTYAVLSLGAIGLLWYRRRSRQ